MQQKNQAPMSQEQEGEVIEEEILKKLVFSPRSSFVQLRPGQRCDVISCQVIPNLALVVG